MSVTLMSRGSNSLDPVLWRQHLLFSGGIDMFSLLLCALPCNQLVFCHVKPNQKLECWVLEVVECQPEVQDQLVQEVLQLEGHLVELAPVLEALVEKHVVDLEQPLEEPLEQVRQVEVVGDLVEEQPNKLQVLLAKSNWIGIPEFSLFLPWGICRCQPFQKNPKVAVLILKDDEAWYVHSTRVLKQLIREILWALLL